MGPQVRLALCLLVFLGCGPAMAKDPNVHELTGDHPTHVEWWNEQAACTCDARTGRTEVTLGTEELERNRSEYQKRCDRLCDDYRTRPCDQPRNVCHHGTKKHCAYWVREGCAGD